MQYAEPFRVLVAALESLPGIGQKTASRLAFHVMKAPRAEIQALAQALNDAHEKMTQCGTCGVLTDVETVQVVVTPFM